MNKSKSIILGGVVLGIVQIVGLTYLMQEYETTKTMELLADIIVLLLLPLGGVVARKLNNNTVIIRPLLIGIIGFILFFIFDYIFLKYQNYSYELIRTLSVQLIILIWVLVGTLFTCVGEFAYVVANKIRGKSYNKSTHSNA